MISKKFQHFQNRSNILKSCRNWFASQNILEVHTNSMSLYANTDNNLESFTTKGSTLQGFLNTSPEFDMKKLLADGCPDCYQISRVYRDGEQGRHHLPEFNLIEWYRLGFDEFELMDEVDKLIHSLVNQHKSLAKTNCISYTQMFLDFCKLDPKNITCQQCVTLCKQYDLPYPKPWLADNDVTAFLDLIMSQLITPQFKKDGLTFVYHYPANQCSLAKCTTTKEGKVAQRFEVYWGALELGNGFNELQNADEQLSRFEKDNQQRISQKKLALPIDTDLIAALTKGLPQCSGVAIGLERLLMVVFNKSHIDLV